MRKNIGITFVDLRIPSAYNEINPRIAREPIGLLEMGAFLKKEAGVDVDYCIIESETYSLSEILKSNPDIVGISTYTYNYSAATNLAKNLRLISPKTLLVFGGPHAGMIPDQVMKENKNFIDAVVSREGDGEEGMLSFLQGQRGIIKSKKIALDKIPFADRVENLFLNSNMAFFNHQPKRLAAVLTSRGCYNSCGFCIDNNSGYRVKPLANVLAEIKYLINQKRIDTIIFEDPLLNGDVPRLEKLCDEIIFAKEHGEVKNFSALSMIGLNLGKNPDVLFEKMEKAGFVQLSWGIEDPRQECRAMLNKTGGTIQFETLALAKKHGIKNRALLMLPTNLYCIDPHKDIEEYAKALIQLPLDEVKINIATPYPGTKFYQELLSARQITDYDWNHYATNHLVFDA